MNKAIYFATFAIGALVGSVATWQIAKKKYEQRVQEEVESVKEAFDRYLEENTVCEEVSNDETTETAKEEVKEEDMKEYKGIADIYKHQGATTKKVTASSKHIFTISPSEFAEEDEYDVVSLSYFEDDRLADPEGQLLDITSTVGHEALTKFGEYEDDVVHVRNTLLKTDYEITLEPRTYSEAYPEYAE